MMIPVIFCKPILLSWGQDPNVVELAAQYIHLVMPAGILNSFGMINAGYCQ